MMHFHHERVSRSMRFEDFMRVLFPKQDKFRYAGACLLQSIGAAENGLDGFELNKLCSDKSISRATMQKTFERLRSLGLVDRREMRYHLNKEFSTALDRLGEAWRGMIVGKKFDFEEGSLKLNV